MCWCHSLLWMVSSAISILVKTPPVLCGAFWPSVSTIPLQFNTLWVPEQQLSSPELSQHGPDILQIEFKFQLSFGMLSVICFNLPVPNQEALPVLDLRTSHHLQIQSCTYSDPFQVPGVLVCLGVSLVTICLSICLTFLVHSTILFSVKVSNISWKNMLSFCCIREMVISEIGRAATWAMTSATRPEPSTITQGVPLVMAL